MIEKKFKDLLTSYFSGEIGHAEIVWMAEDLHKRRERRDLFIERIEDYLENEAGPARRDSDKRLRALLVKDLSQIDIREIELAMPRGRSQSLDQITESINEESRADHSLTRRASVRGQEIRYDDPVVRGKDRSFVMPVVGVAIIVVTFFLMVRFSSIEEDRQKAEEAAMEEQAKFLSDATALQNASEFISENFKELAAAEEESESSEAQVPLNEQAPPISLIELIGERTGSDGVSVAPAVPDEGEVIFIDQSDGN